MAGGEGGGGAAADIQGGDAPARRGQKAAGGGDLLDKSLQIRLHQAGKPLDRLAHKGAVGAAGGAEGDAHIQREVSGLCPLQGVQGGKGAVDAQPAPLRREEICAFQHGVAGQDAAAGKEVAGGQLGGPDAGQSPPGGRLRQQLDRRQIVRLLQKLPPQRHSLPVRLYPPDGPGGAAAYCDGGGGSEKHRPPEQGGHGAVTAGKGRFGEFHRRLGKQLHLQLLQGVALLMAPQKQLHPLTASLI